MVELEYSQAERTVLGEFAAHASILRSAIDKFCREAALRENKECADAMRSVPRDFERAADHAAKSEALTEFFQRLERRIAEFRE
jgi:hypothetical protein